MSIRTATALLALTALPAAACRDGASRAGGTPNVLLICIDTLRADHLGCYGYGRRPTSPALDALAARSTLFRGTSATACWTKPSVPSIFTGTFPLQHGVYRGSARGGEGTVSDVLPDGARTLAEVFREHGYATAAFVRNAQLRVGMGFEQGFDLYRDKAGDAREIRWRATDWLDERDPGRPFFLYLHLLDCHWPYPVPDEYAGLFVDLEATEFVRRDDWRELRDAVNDGRTELSDEQREALIALYDGAIRYADDQMGRLFARLEREGIAEETIVCIVSDHGEEFGEHGRIGHGHGLYETLLHVPWILHVPGRPAAVLDVPTSLVDLYPTLLGAAGIGSGERTEGVDRLTWPDEERAILAEHLEPASYRQSWRKGAFKSHHTLRPLREESEPEADEALPAGGRWEARLVVRDGGLLARRLRPARDQDERPTELKGVVDEVLGDGLVVLGVRVLATDETELYGALETPDGEPRVVGAGDMVKARGALDDSGAFVAAKIKLYPEDEDVEEEVRGILEEVGDGSVVVGGFRVARDDDTELELADEDLDDLGREAVLAYVAALVEGSDPRPFDERVEHFDLAADPSESDARAAGAGGVPDAARTRHLRALLEARFWTDDDTAELSEEQLGDLRALGY